MSELAQFLVMGALVLAAALFVGFRILRALSGKRPACCAGATGGVTLGRPGQGCASCAGCAACPSSSANPSSSACPSAGACPSPSSGPQA